VVVAKDRGAAVPERDDQQREPDGASDDEPAGSARGGPRPADGSSPSDERPTLAGEAVIEDPVEATFERSIEEGTRRLERTWSEMIAAGTIGGLDVATGVLALLLVLHDTRSELLGALAFGIGFVALVLGSSELFTEHFLLPVTARVTHRSDRALAISRLWSVTLFTNVIGGWIAMAIIAGALPRLRSTALSLAEKYPAQGIGWQAFALALLGGMVITLMTWMERGTESAPAKLVAVWGAAFLLTAGPLDHVVIMSLEMSAALVYGAPFGYADAIGAAAWAALGNVVGGIVLVTVLRLVQVGRGAVEAHR
jgi:formate/nitrite transporter FocA (FNT family)